MKFEIKVTGARQIGKTTIMNEILDLLESKAVHQNFNYVQKLKPSMGDGVPSESVVLEITTFAESVARGALRAKLNYTEDEFKREYPFMPDNQ